MRCVHCGLNRQKVALWGGIVYAGSGRGIECCRVVL